MIKFYRGTKAKYQESPSNYTDGLYFTTDTNEILINEEVYGKNADASVTAEEIVVAGGPLSDAIAYWPEDAAWNSGGNRVIPAGTSMQTLTEKLFLKEENGTASWGTISWNPTLASPTAKLETSSKADAGSEVEVGTSLIVKTTTSSTVNGNVRSVTCTANPGYFEADTNGKFVYTAGNKTHKRNGNTADASGFTVTYTWNGNAISNFASESTTVKVASGDNTFKVSQSGVSVTTDALDAVTVYPSTNTKKMISESPAAFTDSADATARTKSNLTSSAKDTIKGYYKYFIGECDALAADGSDITSALVRGLAKSGKMTTSQISYTGTHNSGKGFIVACPATNSIDYIKDDAAVFEGGFSLKTMNVQDAGGDNVSYKVYYCNNTGANAAVYKFFKFK